MKFLLPIGGDIDAREFAGILATYKHRGVPAAIKAGAPWAGDNCAFKNFDEARFRQWLIQMEPYRATCLFIVAPDVVGDARATLKLYQEWYDELSDWPLALVAQDGFEDYSTDEWDPTREEITDYAYDHLEGDDDYAWFEMREQFLRTTTWKVLFIGGSTLWKESEAVVTILRDATELGKPAHIGRVNWGARYTRFRVLAGSDAWTCDGTRTRFGGVDNTLKAWKGYQDQPVLIAV